MGRAGSERFFVGIVTRGTWVKGGFCMILGFGGQQVLQRWYIFRLKFVYIYIQISIYFEG